MTQRRIAMVLSRNFGTILTLLCLLGLSLASRAFTQELHDPYQWDWQASKGWPLKPNLRAAQLNKVQRDEIFKASFNAFVSDNNWSQFISPKSEWPRAIWEARIKLMDLDGDGTPEVLLMGGGLESSGDGNSSFRVLKHEGNEYKVLYDGTAERVSFDTRLDPKHPIVVLYGHDSASEGGLELYQMGPDGKLHNLANYDVDWPNGAFSSKPNLTRTNQRGRHFDH